MAIELSPKPGEICWNQQAIEDFARTAAATGKLVCSGSLQNAYNNNAKLCSLKVTQGEDTLVQGSALERVIPDFHFICPSTDFSSEVKVEEPAPDLPQSAPSVLPDSSAGQSRLSRLLNQPIRFK